MRLMTLVTVRGLLYTHSPGILHTSSAFPWSVSVAKNESSHSGLVLLRADFILCRLPIYWIKTFDWSVTLDKWPVIRLLDCSWFVEHGISRLWEKTIIIRVVADKHVIHKATQQFERQYVLNSRLHCSHWTMVWWTFCQTLSPTRLV